MKSIHNISLIGFREIRVSLASKALWFTVLLLLAAIHGGIFAASWLNSAENNRPILLVSDNLPTVASNAAVEVLPISSNNSLRESVDNGIGDFALVDLDGGWQVYGLRTPNEATKYAITDTIKHIQLADLAQSKPHEFQIIQENFLKTQVEFLTPPDMTKKDNGFVLATVLVLLLSNTLFAARIGGRVTEEKSSSIVEILLSSLNPRELLAGKLLGNLLLGITVVALLLASAFLHIKRSPLSSDFDISGKLIALMIASYIIGMFFFGALYAAVGAIVQRTEDLQTTQMPVVLLIMATMYAPLFGFQFLDSTFIKILSWIPPFSLGLSPLQYVNGNMNLFQVGVALLLLTLATSLIVWGSGVVYKNGVTGIRTFSRKKINRVTRAAAPATGTRHTLKP